MGGISGWDDPAEKGVEQRDVRMVRRRQKIGFEACKVKKTRLHVGDKLTKRVKRDGGEEHE